MQATISVSQDLAEALNLQGVSEEDQHATIASLGEFIMKQFIVHVIDRLSENEKENFKEVVATDDPEKIFAFIFAYIENAEELFIKTAQEVMQLFVTQAHI